MKHLKYKKYFITYNPKPIPGPYDYDCVHEDYDGEDDDDTEFSFCIGSIEAAKEYIDRMELL